MQSDIVPPKGRTPNTKTPKTPPMRSLRLQGHGPDDARKRLVQAEKTTDTVHPKEPEAEAVIALDSQTPPHKNPWHLLKHHLAKRSKIELFILSAIVLLGGSGAALVAFHHPAKEPIDVYSPPPVKAAPKPTTIASPLTGLQVAPDLAKRPVTGVMIENTPDARPQSGLQDAGVVYEAIAEAGITRFLALYQEGQPQYVGPVRSVRPYYIDFASSYQASLAHVGGSPDALSIIRDGHHRDLDEFFNAGSYWRVNTRYAPHNVYTSFAKLDALNQSKGYTSSQFTPWPRKADKPASVPTAGHIGINISSATYNSSYTYDKASNTYLRSEGGAPHMNTTSQADKTGTQIHPKVVIALVMHLSRGALDSTGAYYSNYTDAGSGQAYVFQDGTVTVGTWTRPTPTSMLSFTNASGKTIKLDAGQTWVVLAGAPNQISYTP